MSESKFYQLKAKDPQGKEIAFSDFKGKVTLIVNTATKCGLAPQFKGLEELHQKYKDQGLRVLGFPCNQFLGQEPVSNDSMQETCAINFGVSFPLTEKVKVNGKGTHPVFEYLKSALPGTLGSAIKWNFTKFLIDADGKPVKRFSPQTEPNKMIADIEHAIESGARAK